ncbi:RNA-directed DNA polymerase, eukaryota [Tanacetum coccineum]
MSEDNQKSPFGERGWDVKRILDEDEGGDGDASEKQGWGWLIRSSKIPAPLPSLDVTGDENTKYFHGILNKKRSQLAIRGTLVNGEWISDPDRAVFDFFMNGYSPWDCNSSFIAPIPKIQDAKLVKDFHPISLIGSVYKIIAKLLANILCLVFPYLISEFQSALVSNRQILDGPFILNERLSWCKYKKKSAMIFKVDFEKAFDLVK